MSDGTYFLFTSDFYLELACGAQIMNPTLEEKQREPGYVEEDSLLFCFWIVAQQILRWRTGQGPMAYQVGMSGSKFMALSSQDLVSLKGFLSCFLPSAISCFSS